MAADTVTGNRYIANFDVLHVDAGRGLVLAPTPACSPIRCEP
jgi:hypothetical protein